MSTAPLLVEQEKIVVLDYGSQYNQLITRTIRELGVYSELHAHTITAEELKNMNAVGIILSGGSVSVDDANAYGIDPDIFTSGIPVLGLCYGMQLIVKNFGGKSEKSSVRDYSKETITVETSSKLFNGQAEKQECMDE